MIILLDFVNSKLELYTKLSKPEINDYLKQHLYRAYLEQPSSAVRGGRLMKSPLIARLKRNICQ